MSELDRLMDKWARDHTEDDVDAIIAFTRKQLAIYDSGGKPRKAEAENLDIMQILKKDKPAPKPVAGGFKRMI